MTTTTETIDLTTISFGTLPFVVPDPALKYLPEPEYEEPLQQFGVSNYGYSREDAATRFRLAAQLIEAGAQYEKESDASDNTRRYSLSVNELRDLLIALGQWNGMPTLQDLINGIPLMGGVERVVICDSLDSTVSLFQHEGLDASEEAIVRANASYYVLQEDGTFKLVS